MARPTPSCLLSSEPQRREDREHRDHHERRARHRARRSRATPSAAASRGRAPGAARLADPLEHEDRVVHREPEQDHEREQRQPVGDRARAREAEQALGPVVLEDRREDAVGRADRQQVQRRSRRAASAGERNAANSSTNARPSTNAITSGVALAQPVVEVGVPAASPVTSAVGARGDARARRRDSVAQRGDRALRGVVGRGRASGRRRPRCAPSRATSTSTEPRPPVTVARPRAERPQPALRGRRVEAPCRVTTSSASFGAPGNARSIARSATADGRVAGSAAAPVSPVCRSQRRDGERAEHADGGDRARRPGGA